MHVQSKLPYFIFQNSDTATDVAVKSFLLLFQRFRSVETINAYLPNLDERNIRWLTGGQLKGIQPSTLEKVTHVSRLAFRVKEFTVDQKIAYFNSPCFNASDINKYALSTEILMQLSPSVLHAVRMSSIAGNLDMLSDSSWLGCYKNRAYKGVLPRLSSTQVKELMEEYSAHFTFDQLAHIFVGGTTPEQRKHINFNRVLEKASDPTMESLLRFEGILTEMQVEKILTKFYTKRGARQFNVPEQDLPFYPAIPAKLCFPSINDKTMSQLTESQILAINETELAALSSNSLRKLKDYVSLFPEQIQIAYFKHPEFNACLINQFFDVYVYCMGKSRDLQLTEEIIANIDPRYFKEIHVRLYLADDSLKQKLFARIAGLSIMELSRHWNECWKEVIPYFSVQQCYHCCSQPGLPKQYFPKILKKMGFEKMSSLPGFTQYDLGCSPDSQEGKTRYKYVPRHLFFTRLFDYGSSYSAASEDPLNVKIWTLTPLLPSNANLDNLAKAMEVVCRVGNESKSTLLTFFGLAPTATRNDVNRAYRKLSVQVHPDRNASCQARALEIFQCLGHAYEKLGKFYE